MSSTNKTTNYLLSQFLGTDRLQRDDYNADMLKIDTTLKAKLTIIDLLTAIMAIDGHGSGIDADKLDGAELSIDGTFASNSDTKVPTEKATKAQISSQLATQIAALVNSSPATLDTLNEIATALGNDPNFATTITNLIGTKIEKSAFTALNDFLIGTGAGTYVKKTPTQVQTILNIEPILTGEIKMYGGTTEPAGYFICDGSEKSRTTESALFAVIGTLYGAGGLSRPCGARRVRGKRQNPARTVRRAAGCPRQT